MILGPIWTCRVTFGWLSNWPWCSSPTSEERSAKQFNVVRTAVAWPWVCVNFYLSSYWSVGNHCATQNLPALRNFQRQSQENRSNHSIWIIRFGDDVHDSVAFVNEKLNSMSILITCFVSILGQKKTDSIATNFFRSLIFLVRRSHALFGNESFWMALRILQIRSSEVVWIESFHLENSLQWEVARKWSKKWTARELVTFQLRLQCLRSPSGYPRKRAHSLDSGAQVEL